MNRLFSILATICLALWAGSLVHLVLTVSSLFKAFPKAVSTVALEAAPQIFYVTERYHLGLSVLTLALAIGWRMVGRSAAKVFIILLVLLATVLAYGQTFGLSAKMETLRQKGLSGGPEFTDLHHWSTKQYGVQTGMILLALCFVPTASTKRFERIVIDAAPKAPKV